MGLVEVGDYMMAPGLWLRVKVYKITASVGLGLAGAEASVERRGFKG